MALTFFLRIFSRKTESIKRVMLGARGRKKVTGSVEMEQNDWDVRSGGGLAGTTKL